MKTEEISKFAQTCFQGCPTIVLGSGASMPHGLPSMGALSDYLRAEMQTNGDAEEEAWTLVRTALANGDHLEAALLILTNASGGALTPHRASEGVRQWRDKAKLSDELRLYDARGTAATRLLNADLSLAKIANHMGWSIRYAANVIEHYARVSPDETDAVLVKLAQAKGG